MYNQYEDMDANSEQQPLTEIPIGVILIEDFNKLYEELRQEKWWDKYSRKWRFYPHLVLRPNENGDSQCNFCGAVMRSDDKWVYLEEIGCTERPKPCEWCGESPLCAPDCVGIRMALSDPLVYTIGEPYD